MTKFLSLILVIFALVVSLSLAGCAARSLEPVQAGDKAPDFTLPSTDGGQVSLAALVANTNVLLYFNMAYG